MLFNGQKSEMKLDSLQLDNSQSSTDTSDVRYSDTLVENYRRAGDFA